MKSRKKINKKIIIIIIIIIAVLTIPAFARYTYNTAKDMYLASKSFYFTSDLLGENKNYTNWGGAEPFVINFELYSYDNEYRKTEENVEASIKANITSGDATCYIETDSKTSNKGSQSAEISETIKTNNGNKIKVKVYIVPNKNLVSGSVINIKITAKSILPYAKTLSSTIKLTALAEMGKFEIKDEVGRNYAILNISNYQQKNVVLSFDPNIIRIDSNNTIFNTVNLEKDIETTKIDNVDYINKITIQQSKESSKNIKFYKVDKNNDYTYSQNSNVGETPVINVEFK